MYKKAIIIILFVITGCVHPPHNGINMLHSTSGNKFFIGVETLNPEFQLYIADTVDFGEASYPERLDLLESSCIFFGLGRAKPDSTIKEVFPHLDIEHLIIDGGLYTYILYPHHSLPDIWGARWRQSVLSSLREDFIYNARIYWKFQVEYRDKHYFISCFDIPLEIALPTYNYSFIFGKKFDKVDLKAGFTIDFTKISASGGLELSLSQNSIILIGLSTDFFYSFKKIHFPIIGLIWCYNVK